MPSLKQSFSPTNTSSSEYDPSTGLSTVEFFASSRDSYRKCGKKHYPTPWPFERRKPLDLAVKFIDSIREEYEKILRVYGLQLEREVLEAQAANYTRGVLERVPRACGFW